MDNVACEEAPTTTCTKKITLRYNSTVLVLYRNNTVSARIRKEFLMELMGNFFDRHLPALLALKKIKSSLYSRYYAKVCNDCRSSSPRLSTCWAAQLRTSEKSRSVCKPRANLCFVFNLIGPGIEPVTCTN